MPMSPQFKFFSPTSLCSGLRYLNAHATVLPGCLTGISNSVFFFWRCDSWFPPYNLFYQTPPQLFHFRKWHYNYTFSYSNSNPGIQSWRLFPFLAAICNIAAISVESVSKYILTLLLTPQLVPSRSKATIISVLIALSAPSLAFTVKSQPECHKVVWKRKQNWSFPCLKHSSGF